MRRPPGGSRIRLAAALGFAAVLFAVAFVLPAMATAVAPLNTGRSLQTSGIDGVTASVTWDGSNIATASSASSAFQIHVGGVANVLFTWSSPPLSSNSIDDARLQMFYFGFSLITRDVTQTAGTASGHVPMNWSTGALAYALEGTYRVEASLLASNGTTMWSETFWVDLVAPYYILALLPIVFILIIIYEIYNVATVGKHAALAARAADGGAPPASPPAAPTSSSETPTESPPPATPPPSAPPSGGAS